MIHMQTWSHCMREKDRCSGQLRRKAYSKRELKGVRRTPSSPAPFPTVAINFPCQTSHQFQNLHKNLLSTLDTLGKQIIAVCGWLERRLLRHNELVAQFQRAFDSELFNSEKNLGTTGVFLFASGLIKVPSSCWKVIWERKREEYWPWRMFRFKITLH